MKKFFAIALAFVMFASVNMFAEEANTDDATVEVHVLQPMTVVTNADYAEVVLNLVNGTDYAITEGNVLEWTITGSGGHDFTWTLTTAPPTNDDGTLDVTYTVNEIDAESNDASISGTAGVYTNTRTLSATHEGDEQMTIKMKVTNVDLTGNPTPGIYTATQTLTADYVL